jgi:hypothetical protein
MDLIEELNSYKQECERMAKIARDRDSKATWASMAERWERLAEKYRLEMTHKAPRRSSHRRIDRVRELRAA